MSIPSERQPDRNELKPISPGNIDVDLAREQVPGHNVFSRGGQKNGDHLDLFGDIYASGKYGLLADAATKRKQAAGGPIIEKLKRPIEELRARTREYTPEPGILAEPITYREPLSRVFGSSYSELGRHHNQVLDVNLSDLLKKQGIGSNEPLILCNFDTHSDILKSPMDNEGSIASWVNRMIADNKQITDFYWVMPDELKNKKEYRDHFFSGKGKDGNLADDPIDQTIFINNETQEIHWKKPDDYSATNYREIGIHKRTLDEMPDMKNKHVIWTTDLDGFDNYGWDTSAKAKIPWQGQNGFEKYVKTMDEKNIRPFFHFIAQSEEYTTGSHDRELNRFAVEAGAVSLNGGDINITNYRNFTQQYKKPPMGEEILYNGITTARQADPKYELLYKLFATDARTTSADGKVVLNKPNAEYDVAIDETVKAYSGREDRAKELIRKSRDPAEAIHMMENNDPRIRAIKILRYLDSEDGKADGILNFRAIENDIIERARRKTQ